MQQIKLLQIKFGAIKKKDFVFMIKKQKSTTNWKGIKKRESNQKTHIIFYRQIVEDGKRKKIMKKCKEKIMANEKSY